MAFANMMNAPAPAASAGCLHNSPAAVLHARSAPHCHRRPTKDFRVQAVAETETRAPATSNGSTPKVHSGHSSARRPESHDVDQAVHAVAGRGTSWHTSRRDIGMYYTSQKPHAFTSKAYQDLIVGRAESALHVKLCSLRQSI